MKYKDKNLEDIVVTLPFADGTEEDYGVFAYFVVEEKGYFAMLPLIGKRQLDFTQTFSLYRVEEDGEENPVVVYIEDDLEYEKAANYFSEKYLKR